MIGREGVAGCGGGGSSGCAKALLATIDAAPNSDMCRNNVTDTSNP
jgi:hypothetical protein